MSGKFATIPILIPFPKVRFSIRLLLINSLTSQEKKNTLSWKVADTLSATSNQQKSTSKTTLKMLKTPISSLQLVW